MNCRAGKAGENGGLRFEDKSTVPLKFLLGFISCVMIEESSVHSGLLGIFSTKHYSTEDSTSSDCCIHDR